MSRQRDIASQMAQLVDVFGKDNVSYGQRGVQGASQQGKSLAETLMLSGDPQLKDIGFMLFNQDRLGSNQAQRYTETMKLDTKRAGQEQNALSRANEDRKLELAAKRKALRGNPRPGGGGIASLVMPNGPKTIQELIQQGNQTNPRDDDRLSRLREDFDLKAEFENKERESRAAFLEKLLERFGKNNTQTATAQQIVNNAGYHKPVTVRSSETSNLLPLLQRLL